MGVKKIVPALIKSGCKNFFVATTNEAIELRKISKHISIFILNGLVTNELKLMKYKLIPVINNLKQLFKIENFKEQKIKLKIALHFDTGMSRLGFDNQESKFLFKNKSIINHSEVVLIMSHLAYE